MHAPFLPANKQSYKPCQRHYQEWRDHKLAAYPVDISQLMTDISTTPQTQNIQRILHTVTQFNLALYRLPHDYAASKTAVHRLATACGLRNINHNLCADADSLTSLQVTNHPGQQQYIPYTNRPLNWHTDGYYNDPATQIHGMLLHCARPAEQGGENLFMDHEIAYILLRETDPAYITALMHPQALTIPANIIHGEVVRPEQSGAVFSLTPDGYLHMRYSARQRNVIWRDDKVTKKAARFLLDLWQQDSIYKLRYTLGAGEGVICNNVLHCRTGFVDQENKQRLLYRGRYIDRVSEPD